MRYLDQRLRPLADRLTEEVGDSVLRHDPVDVSAARHDARTRLEGGLDAADLSALRRGGQRDDGLAVPAARGAPDEVHLTTDAGIEATVQGVGSDLPVRSTARAELIATMRSF